MSKSNSNFDGARLGVRRSQAEAEGIWPGRERTNPNIRNTLLGERYSEEYIGTIDVTEGATSYPQDSLIKSSGTKVSEEGAKAMKRKLSTVNTVVNAPEWTMLRLLSAIGGGFDLEMWWRRGNISNRLTAIVTAILLAISILNLVVGITFIVQSLTDIETEPDVCTTPACHNASIRLKEFMSKDKSIGPCDNFYEFMCGGKILDKGEEGDLFGELITLPGVTVELGKINILGKIMKWNQPNKDQHITFYRSCLNYNTRDKYGLAALRESVQHWFGTENFDAFPTQKSMEEIAAAIFTDVGHASFINMAFYTYPFILILEPHPYTMEYRFEKDDRNKIFLETLFGKLMLRLELLSDDEISKEIIQDMVTGTDVMSTVVYEILSGVKKLKDIPKDASLENLPKGIADIIDGKLSGLCPPMGIRLDYFKVLELFLKEDDYKVEYLSPTVRKYVLGLRTCFKKDPGQFTKYKIKHPRTAFVAVWIADIFLHDFIFGVDYKTISMNWNFTEIGEDHELVKRLSNIANFNDEYLCLDLLWTALGYLPTTRFLESDPDQDANRDIYEFEGIANKYYFDLQRFISGIKKSEVDWKLKRLAETVFKRRLYSELGFPLVGGIVDFKIGMELKFTDDFLNNSLIGFKYTVARARHNWLASTNPQPSMKYFGSGGPGNIRRDLFVPRYLRVDSARLVEKELAAKNQEWETFLGRKQKHYIRFPLTLFDEQHFDSLALKHDVTVWLTQGMLALLNDVLSEEKYPSLTWEELFGESQDRLSDKPSDSMSCGLLEVPINSTHESRLNPTMTMSNVSHYNWNNQKLFLAVLTAKLTYFGYRFDRYTSNEVLKYTYNQTEKRKHYITNKRLGFGLEKYTEAQLFFMGYVRKICRESWKLDKHTEEERQKHYSLEVTVLTTLMQMREFSEVWKCGEKAKMSNMGQPRCINWIPGDESFKRYHV